VRCDGTLYVKPPGLDRTRLRFQRGFLASAAGHWLSPQATRAVLSRVLPEAQLRLAEQHAVYYGVPLDESVERLSLLPPPSVAASRQSLMWEGIESLCELLPDDTRFAIVEEQDDGARATEPPLDTLGLIVGCAARDPRFRAADAVAAFADVSLGVTSRARDTLLASLEGAARAVVSQLAIERQSFRELERLELMSRRQLAASVYALWLTHALDAAVLPWPGLGGGETVAGASGTHRVALPADRFAPSGPLSTMPPSRVGPASKSSAPPSVGPQSARDGRQASRSMTPSRVPNEPLSRTNGARLPSMVSADVYARERAAEKKVLDALMAADLDPNRAEKTSQFARKTASVFPRNPRIRLYAARAHLLAAHTAEAIVQFEEALRLDPNNEDAKVELARALRDQSGC
jgi:tetratricopeptide (TPR) repeat protein